MEKEMAEMYTDGTYLENNPTWHVQDSPWKANHIKTIIDRNGLNPNSVCEVGCGAGEILKQLSGHYPETEFYGYEISPQAFALCNKKSTANLSFRLQDLLDDDSAYFDIAMAIDVFEHVEDYFGFLRKLRKKAEYKIFHIPLDLSVQKVFRYTSILERRADVGHIHYFTKETALETLKDTGYEIVDYFYTGSAIELPDVGWKASLLKIPRKVAFSVSEDWTVRILGGYSIMVLAR